MSDSDIEKIKKELQEKADELSKATGVKITEVKDFKKRVIRSERIVDLQGWDSVSAMSYNTLNLGIKDRLRANLAKEKITYKTETTLKKDTTVNGVKKKKGDKVTVEELNASFDNIRLRLGGDGKLFWFDVLLDITKLTLDGQKITETASDGTTTGVKNCTIVLQLNAELVNRSSSSVAGQPSSSGDEGEENKFSDIGINTEKSIVPLSKVPAFTPNDILDEMQASEVQSMIMAWFDDGKNADVLKLILASFPQNQSDNTGLDWLQNTDTGYAIVVPEPQSMNTATFGVMFKDGDAGKLPFQISALALPYNCDAGLSIARPLFLQHIIMKALATLFKKGTGKNADIQDDEILDYFELQDDNTAIQNSKMVYIANLELDNGDKVQLPVEKGQFNCSLEGSTFKVQMEKVEFAANWLQNAKLFFKAEYRIYFNPYAGKLDLHLITRTVDLETETKSWVLDLEIALDLAAIVLIVASLGFAAMSWAITRSAQIGEQAGGVAARGERLGGLAFNDGELIFGIRPGRRISAAEEARKLTKLRYAGYFRNAKWAAGTLGVFVELISRFDNVLVNAFESDLQDTKTKNIVTNIEKGLQDKVTFPLHWDKLALNSIEVHDALQFGYSMPYQGLVAFPQTSSIFSGTAGSDITPGRAITSNANKKLSQGGTGEFVGISVWNKDKPVNKNGIYEKAKKAAFAVHPAHVWCKIQIDVKKNAALAYDPETGEITLANDPKTGKAIPNVTAIPNAEFAQDGAKGDLVKIRLNVSGKKS